MSDLPEKLREAVNKLADIPMPISQYEWQSISMTVHQAAARIEELEAEVKDLNNKWTAAYCLKVASEARIEGLEATLVAARPLIEAHHLALQWSKPAAEPYTQCLAKIDAALANGSEGNE